MNVGLTYDLRGDYLLQGYSEEETAEFDSPETVAAIEGALTALGHSSDRIGGVRNLAARLAKGDRWDLVFNFAEGMYGIGREAQVPALLDAYQIPYTFSDALVMALTLHKGMTKHVVRDLGIPTADFAVVHEEAQVDGIRLSYPLFVKPAAGGTSVGISAECRVVNLAELRAVSRDLLRRFQQPVLVETYLPGRELTVGMLGTGPKADVFGVMEVQFSAAAEPHCYSYFNKQHYEGRVAYRLATDAVAAEAADIACRVWRGLGCRDAGRVDCRCDESGRVHFIEVNPLAGLHPVHSDLIVLAGLLDVPYQRIIDRIVTSASERVGSTLAVPAE